MQQIKGGYYIKARAIQESEIAHAPPHTREIWDWLIREANFKEGKSNGRIINRGQCVRSYKDIQDGLKWMVGYRKMTYSKNQIETAMKWLTKRSMIHTTKTTRGMVITVLNYDTYQDPKNYEAYSGIDNKTTTGIQGSDTINKNGKNVNNGKKEKSKILSTDSDLVSFLKETYTDIKNPSELEAVAIPAYPGIDLLNESRMAYAWEVANPERQKKDHKRFLNNWWKRAQDKPKPFHKSSNLFDDRKQLPP